MNHSELCMRQTLVATRTVFFFFFFYSVNTINMSDSSSITQTLPPFSFFLVNMHEKNFPKRLEHLHLPGMSLFSQSE